MIIPTYINSVSLFSFPQRCAWASRGRHVRWRGNSWLSRWGAALRLLESLLNFTSKYEAESRVTYIIRLWESQVFLIFIHTVGAPCTLTSTVYPFIQPSNPSIRGLSRKPSSSEIKTSTWQTQHRQLVHQQTTGSIQAYESYQRTA